MSSILILEDVEEIGQILCEYANKAGYSSQFFTHFMPADLPQYQQAGLIILDLNMPGSDGLDVLEYFGSHQVQTPIVLCSGVSEDIIDSAVEVLRDCGLVFGGKLLKPFTYEQFLGVVHQARNKPSSPIQLASSSAQTVNLTKGDLAIAIKRDWFYAMFQPQMDVSNHRVFGVECLARLHHPLFGQCYPNVFINKLRESNLSDAFTQALLTSTLRALSSIDLPKDIRISFNIDPCSLHKDFLTNLEAQVLQAGFRPQQICFEITELSAVVLSKDIKSLLAKLRLRGFDISLDDFGTGFSTILELDVLPFNELKIDRAFVANMHQRKGTLAIVKNTIGLARDMNMLVVAEGIETQDQASTLQDMGCRYLQGYYFSRPLSLHALRDFIAQPADKRGAG